MNNQTESVTMDKRDIPSTNMLINLPKEEQYINSKAFLQSAANKSGKNLYDHLSRLLTKILTERPENVFDMFEELSKTVKKETFISEKDTLLDKPDKATEAALAEVQRKLYDKTDGEEDFAPDQDIETPLPNILEYMFFFEQAGVGLSREEVYRIWLAMKRLVDTNQLQHVRFWGKVFGLEQNYIIAEAELGNRDEEEEAEEEEEEEKPEEEEPEPAEEAEEEGDPLPPEPKSTWKAPPEIPKEDKAGKPWIKLPPVTPKQIQTARKIKKFMVGRLDAPVTSYPPFPGNEANYLRAQIARISAGTHISPADFYIQEGEEEEEEGEVNDTFMENTEYEVKPIRELANLNSWCHHVLYILNQGRTKWWDPNQKGDDEELEDEDEEEKEMDAPQREEGVGLFKTRLDDDKAIDGTPPWSVKISTDIIPQHAICVIKSNLWPGSYAFARQKLFENIYIGWGHKYSVANFNPAPMAGVQDEFPSGPEITETEDPTPEEEAQAQRAKAEAEEGAEEQEEEEAEDEEDD